MRHLIYAIPVALGLVAIPGSATAQEFMFDPYIGGGAGAFAISDGNGTNLVFGGYGSIGAKVADYLGIEARIGTAGAKTKYDSTVGTTVKNQVGWFVSYLARPQVILAEGFRLYGLIGATTLSSSITATGGAKVSKTNTDFTYGAGIQYSPSDNNFYIGGEWVKYASSASHATLTTTHYDGMDMQSYVVTVHYEF